MAQAIYCCKKWLNGRIVRFMSASPCAGGSVLCHEPDPKQAGVTGEPGDKRPWEPPPGGDGDGGGGDTQSSVDCPEV